MIEPVWPEFDKDGNGYISSDEFVDLATKVLEKGGKSDQFDPQ